MASSGYAAVDSAPLAEAFENKGTWPPDSFHINIKTFDANCANCFDLVVEAGDTVNDVKAKIQEVNGISPDLQLLVFRKKKLVECSSTLNELQVRDGAFLTLLKLSPEIESATAAPFLQKYWQTYAVAWKSTMKLMISIAMRCGAVLSEDDFFDGFKQHEDEMKSLLKSSFERHDKNGDGVLDRDEACVFFSHLVEEGHRAMKSFAPLMDIMKGEGSRIEIKLRLELLELASGVAEPTPDDVMAKARGSCDEYRKLFPDITDEEVFQMFSVQEKASKIFKEYRALKEEHRAVTRSMLEESLQIALEEESESSEAVFRNRIKREEYLAAKAERDAKAFALLDVNGDGTIVLSDVIDALDPRGKKAEEFTEILGLGFKQE